MTTMLIANNETVESGSFMGDALCSLKTTYLFAEHAPEGTDKFIMSVSPGNSLHFLWQKFIDRYNVQLVWDNWNTGDWPSRWSAWDTWRKERVIEGIPFDYYRELHLRIHGMVRQQTICGSERGFGLRNIYSYWWCGQENCPDELPPSVDWFDDSLIYHTPHTPLRDVYISPHAKTQGNYIFTFDFWEEVVRNLIDAGVAVTVGYDNPFCEDLVKHPLYKKHWGTHKEWMEQIYQHKLVACGNTGTGWLAAACGVPMITMEPPNSIMPEHRFRQCGLKNIVEVVDKPDAVYVSNRIIKEVGGNTKAIGAHRICQEAVPYSVNPYGKLKLMADQFLSVSHLQGDIADLGAMRGGTSLILRKLAPDKHLHIFDNWGEGTPYDDPLCHHKKGEWAVPLRECQNLVGNGEFTHYIKGVFPQEIDGVREKQFCFVYIDMDTFQATYDALEFFWLRLVPGGKIVVDDWKWEPCSGVKEAVNRFFSCSDIGTEFKDQYTLVVTK